MAAAVAEIAVAVADVDAGAGDGAEVGVGTGIGRCVHLGGRQPQGDPHGEGSKSTGDLTRKPAASGVLEFSTARVWSNQGGSLGTDPPASRL